MRNLLSFKPNVQISSFSDSSKQEVILLPICSNLPIMDGLFSLLKWMDIDSTSSTYECDDLKNEIKIEGDDFQSDRTVFSS